MCTLFAEDGVMSVQGKMRKSCASNLLLISHSSTASPSASSIPENALSDDVLHRHRHYEVVP